MLILRSLLGVSIFESTRRTKVTFSEKWMYSALFSLSHGHWLAAKQIANTHRLDVIRG
jgi:hypothetical protein